MRDPDLTGVYGRAWLLKSPDGLTLAQSAGLATWLVNRPGAHPFWQWWSIAVIHLRDIPGVPPANKRYPTAEFEFMIYSIDPEHCPNPVPDDPNGYPHLIPFDVVEQFHGISDTDAIRLCEGAVRSIVERGLSPDQDYRSMWASLIEETVRHFAAGKHPLH